jgi:hypothetical protein
LTLLSHRNDFLASFEDVNKIPISASNFGDCIISCYLACTPVHEWTPEARPANGETIETRNRSSGRKPFADLPIVLAAAEDDATDSVSASPAGCSHEALAVFMTLEPFDLPHVRLNPGILKLLNGLSHKLGTKLQIVGLLVSFQAIELALLGRD